MTPGVGAILTPDASIWKILVKCLMPHQDAQSTHGDHISSTWACSTHKNITRLNIISYVGNDTFQRWSLFCLQVSNQVSNCSALKNQSSERPVRSESLKLWTSKILFFSLNYRWLDWFKIKQNTAISKHFTHSVYRTTSGTIFSMDVWISGSQVIFQYKPGAYL